MTYIKNKVNKFIVQNFLFGEKGDLEDDTSFLENGIIDSTGILELIDFLENEFSLRIDDDDILPDNFDSVEKVVNYIAKRING